VLRLRQALSHRQVSKCSWAALRERGKWEAETGPEIDAPAGTGRASGLWSRFSKAVAVARRFCAAIATSSEKRDQFRAARTTSRMRGHNLPKYATTATPGNLRTLAAKPGELLQALSREGRRAMSLEAARSLGGAENPHAHLFLARLTGYGARSKSGRSRCSSPVPGQHKRAQAYSRRA